MIDLKSKKDGDPDEIPQKSIEIIKFKPTHIKLTHAITPQSGQAISDYDWDVVDEYDPLWPNDYEKLVKGKDVV